MTSNLILDEALAALDRGHTPVPVSAGKYPAILWKNYQTEHPHDTQVKSWFSRLSHYTAWGLVHGEHSGTIVLDFDNKPDAGGGLEKVLTDLIGEFGDLPHTVTATTPSGGAHFFYRHPGVRVPTRKNIRPGLDVRGDGGFSVGPGSDVGHGRYLWLDHPDLTTLADLPQPWIDVITAPIMRQTVSVSAGGTVRQSTGDIVLETRAGPFGMPLRIVVDGRESHANRTIWVTLQRFRETLGRNPTEAELHRLAYREFAQTTDLTRPVTSWRFADRVRKALSEHDNGLQS